MKLLGPCYITLQKAKQKNEGFFFCVYITAPTYPIPIRVAEAYQGFPDCSVGKESACNAGDSSSIPVLGRSAGEGKGYPLQYSCTFLVAQLVKKQQVMNLPAMQETWV